MGKVPYDDKMRMQTLYEKGYSARRIKNTYPQKHWSLSTINRICQRIKERGSATTRKVGSGRPKSARTPANIIAVEELLCSQENEPGTSLSTRQVAQELGISCMSVCRIAKNDLDMQAFKRMPVQVINESTQIKRLQRCKQLLTRLKGSDWKKMFFTDEKMFYLDPPMIAQNDRVWASGRKRDIAAERLLYQRAKFSRRVMVSAGVCYNGKGRLHFVPEKAKIKADYYVSNLLPELLEDCFEQIGSVFIFQQDGAPAHTAKHTQDFLLMNCPDFIDKNEWPPNSPDLNPLDYHVWGEMMTRYSSLSPKPTDIAQLKEALQKIWDELPQASINKAISTFRPRLQSCIAVKGGHIEQRLH